MPFIPYKSAVVKQLNILNVQTILPTDVVFGSFEASASDPTRGSAAMVGRATGPLANAGRAAVQYRRIPLSALAALWPDPVNLTVAPTLYESLERLGQSTGIRFTTKDVSDVALDFNSGKLTLTAKPTSNRFSGSVTINIKARALQDLSTYWPRTALNRTTLLADMTDLIKLANNTNQRYVDVQALTNNGIADSTDPRGNTLVEFVGKAAYGFTGTVGVYFNRDSISDQFPDLYMYSTTPYTGTTRQFVQNYFPQILDKVLLESIIDDPVSYGSTGKDVNVPIRIASTSLNVGGTLTAKVYWQAATDFTSVRTAYTQYAVKDLTVASVGSVRGRTLTQQFYGTSVRTANVQYAVRELTVASVASVRGKMLIPQLYGTSLRQAFLQYAVADT